VHTRYDQAGGPTLQTALIRGQFVINGNSTGVVAEIYTDRNVREDHVAVWFGELTASGNPRVKIVPLDAVTPLEKPAEYYH
jgi:hypothetical protein